MTFWIITSSLKKIYIDFYYGKKGIYIASAQTLPIIGVMQGDPHAGPAWDKKIFGALSKMRFKPNKVFPCLYLCEDYNGGDILISRQIDDFKVAAKDVVIIQKVIPDI